MVSAPFITFEGPEGAGKSTVIEGLTPDFDQYFNGQFLVTREPGGTPIAEGIRQLLQTDDSQGMDPWTEAYLFAAARRQHLTATVLPALKAGQAVISDRYLDSSLAYQGGGRQFGVDQIYQLNHYATQGLMPDLTLYLDLPVELGLERIMSQRGDKIDRLDKEDLAFHERVRDTYLTLQEQFSDRIKIIDASQPLPQVVDDVRAVLAAWRK
ncbi:dTMP kinase [Lactobacillaceae bacterium L1_55_11]|nr:dTMP kinase [Lactobacillaceae bacterium L1_55_11]